MQTLRRGAYLCLIRPDVALPPYELDGSGDSDAAGSVEPDGDGEAAGADGDAAGDGATDGAGDGDGTFDAAGPDAAGEAPEDGAVEATGASVGPNVQPAPAVLELLEHAWVTAAAIASDATATVRLHGASDRCMSKAYPSLLPPGRHDQAAASEEPHTGGAGHRVGSAAQCSGSSSSDAELMQ